MRCLHIVPSYWPAVRYGGTITAVRGLCNALARLGHQVTVLTTNADGQQRLDVPLESPVMVDNVEVRYFPVKLYRPCYSPAMGKVLKEYVASADIVHLHSIFLWPIWAGARAAKNAGVPYLLSPRGMLVRDLMRKKNQLVKILWSHLAGRRTIREAAAIHVTSNLEREDLHKSGFGLPRVVMIENGIDCPPLLPVDDNDMRLSLGLTSDEPLILFMGRISWKKGLDRLIQAMRYVPAGRLVIAGNDDEGYTARLRAIIAGEQLGERVIFCGGIYGDRKWALLRAATCFVLPSYSENFGNTVLEAMCMGCPVVVTPEVGAAEIVKRHGAGLVTPGDPASLGHAIAQLVADRQSGIRMGSAGARAAKEAHAWTDRAEEMVGVYRELVHDAGYAK